jgi:hypothetical protein
MTKRGAGMDENTKSGGRTRKNLEKLDPTKFLNGWADQTSVEDAAVLVQILRDKPELLKTKFGMKAHKLATDKIRGTWWEKALYEGEKTDASVKRFREANEQIEHQQNIAAEDALEERRKRSVIYLEKRRQEKQAKNEPDGAA